MHGDGKRFATGFWLFVTGWVLIATGVVLGTQVWGPLGFIAFLGVPGAGWLKYPSDWRKQWPGDFPRASKLVARVLGNEPHSR